MHTVDNEDFFDKPHEQQEPVAVVRSVVHAGEGGVRVSWLRGFPQIGDRLYTSPPPRKPWVGLTDWEREKLRSEADDADAGYSQIIKATEAKLREKNA